MSKPRDNQKDLLRPALDEIIDPYHPLVPLARELDWAFLDGRFRSVCRSGPGQPPLPTRLVAGLLIDLLRALVAAIIGTRRFHQTA